MRKNESSLTWGLLWLEKFRQSAKRAALAGLRLIFPKGKSPILANRLRALNERLAIEVFELNPQRETLEKVDPCAGGNVTSRLMPRRERQLLLDRTTPALAPLIALSPESIRAHVICVGLAESWRRSLRASCFVNKTFQ